MDGDRLLEIESSFRIVEVDVPRRAIAERLVSRLAAAAEGAGLLRLRLVPLTVLHSDYPGQMQRTVLATGIPWVRDRVVQAALRLVMEPIFEREFVAHR